MNDKAKYDIFSSGRVLLMDGGMGTMLMAEGVGGDEVSTAALCHPVAVREIHRAYLDAGADIITACSFGVDAPTAKVAAQLAVAEAKEAMARDCSRRRYVAGSLCGHNADGTRGERLIDDYSAKAAALIEGGVDMLLVETVTATATATAAVEGARRAMHKAGRDLPLLVSATIVGAEGVLPSGESVEQFVDSVGDDVDGIGVNCADVEVIGRCLPRLKKMARCPVMVAPSAGVPDADGRYRFSAAEMAQTMGAWIAAGGVAIVGGCCGTSPRLTRLLRPLIQ